ncbi:hypothetical protein ABPG77_009251 [Micractinium sp. CCAP 211/92]
MTAHAEKLLGRAPCSKHLWGCALALLLLAALRSYPVQGPPHRPVTDAPPPLVHPAEVPPNCLLLQRVCVDQQQIVMMDPAYLPQNEERPLPNTRTEPFKLFFNLPVTAGSNPDVWVVRQRMPLLNFRRPTVMEPTFDLRHPRFETHTLPLLFIPDWLENFGHTLGNSATFLHAHLRNATWASRAQLVVQTPLGLSLPQHWQALVRPLLPNFPIQTLADFSNRLEPHEPAGWVARILGRRAAFGGPPPTRSRCFAEMLVCPGLKENESVNISQTASFIAQSYAKEAEAAPPITYTSSSPECSGNAGSRRPANGAAADKGPTCLRVLFKMRPAQPAVRQILNMPQLLEECRRWRFTDPASGATFAATCASWQPGSDLAANIAAVRSADVLIGKHGAGMANAFFMHPGGAMFEVFSTGWTWQVHREWLDQEQRPQLQWWALTVQDPAALKPGELEARLMPHPRLYNVRREGLAKRLRDRNLRVPWQGLDVLLQEYSKVQAAGGMAAYWDRRLTHPEPVHYCWTPAHRLRKCGTGLQGGPFRPGRDNRALLNRTRIIE